MAMLEATLVGPDDRTQRLNRIAERRQEMHPARALLGLIAVLLAGLGRLAFAVVAGVWLVATWCAAAVAVGWAEAREAQSAKREAAQT